MGAVERRWVRRRQRGCCLCSGGLDWREMRWRTMPNNDCCAAGAKEGERERPCRVPSAELRERARRRRDWQWQVLLQAGAGRRSSSGGGAADAVSCLRLRAAHTHTPSPGASRYGVGLRWARETNTCHWALLTVHPSANFFFGTFSNMQR